MSPYLSVYPTNLTKKRYCPETISYKISEGKNLPLFGLLAVNACAVATCLLLAALLVTMLLALLVAALCLLALLVASLVARFIACLVTCLIACSSSVTAIISSLSASVAISAVSTFGLIACSLVRTIVACT